jgi:pyridoxal phosphate enzyme (YggS family)
MKADTIDVDVHRNYREVLERITGAAERAGRDPQEVRLVVVTKGHPVEMVEAAVAAGARLLGENYAEEGIAKMQAVGSTGGVEWHMIGHVQSRKAQIVCQHYQWVHSLDSSKLANRLDRFAGELRIRLPVLLECNVSGEQSKYGLPTSVKEEWEALVPQVAQIVSLPNLQVRGLMTMAPFLSEPEDARPYFRRLAHLREFLAARFPHVIWSELSMGMSADFEVAVQEGATLVRVGTSILGPRTRV